jgi:hypothetical protein
MKLSTAVLACGLFVCATLSQADDKWNIRTSPWFFLGANVSELALDYRVADSWSVGPSLQFGAYFPALRVALRATHFEQKTFESGWMTGIELRYSEVTSYETAYEPSDAEPCSYDSGDQTDCIDPYSADLCSYDIENQTGCSAQVSELVSQQVGLALDHGYLWRWDAFNVGLGFGSSLSWTDQGRFQLTPAGYFSVGWIR